MNNKSNPSLIESNTYKEFILYLYEERLQLNPSFSFRKLASELGISPSTLSEHLNEKHIPSIQLARRMARNLKLTNEETDHLIDLTLLKSSYGKGLREGALSRILKRRQSLTLIN